jgi:hypothetical protein
MSPNNNSPTSARHEKDVDVERCFVLMQSYNAFYRLMRGEIVRAAERSVETRDKEPT